MNARLPAVAEFGMAVESELLAALFLNHATANIDPAIFHRVQVETEIGAGPYLAAHFERVSGPAQREVLNPVQRIVAAADGPVVSQPEHLAVQRTMSDVGSEETA